MTKDVRALTAEILLENAEAFVDAAISDDNKLAQEIPFVGTAVKLTKIGASVSDRILRAKLARLFDSLNRASPAERDRLHERILRDDAEATRIGEVTLLTVDRANDLEKPRWVAMLLLGYLEDTRTRGSITRTLA